MFCDGFCFQRHKRANELIEKDDAARDEVGLPKPDFDELEAIAGLKQPSASKCDAILRELGFAPNPPASLFKAADR